MSSCLSGGGGGRTYSFDLDLVKPPPAASSRSSHASSPSSTLSESSNSALTISIKKTRTSRKRPNQTYNEAAALLSTIYPNVFSTKGLKKLSRSAAKLFCSFPEPSDLLLPPLPVLSDAAFLLHQSHRQEPTAAAQIELKHKFATDKDYRRPVSSSVSCSLEPNSPGSLKDEFDAESILDEEVEEGIDSIMGNLSVNTPSEEDNNDGVSRGGSSINPLLRSLVGCRISGGSDGDQLELGLGLRLGRNLRWALKTQDNCEWWRTPTVPVQNILPNFKPPAAKAATDKKKKKPEKEEVSWKKITNTTISTETPKEKVKAGLGLKLNHVEVLKEWSDRSSIFLDGVHSLDSSADALARLSDIDLFPDADGVREASITRSKEKRRSQLFSKKVRYHVRKMNAGQLSTMKTSDLR